MKIVILGAGKMGSFFADVLSFDHEIALYDIDPYLPVSFRIVLLRWGGKRVSKRCFAHLK